MKITLLSGDIIELSNTNEISERIQIVNKIISDNEEMIYRQWSSPSVRYMLEGLSNYLVWCKSEEELNKHDKLVLSKDKIKKINSYDEKNIPFSALSKTDKTEIGINEVV